MSDSIDAYKARRARYAEAGEYDQAWCMCNALVFLRGASRDEQRFHDQYKPGGLVKAKAKLTEASWAKLSHRDEDRAISTVLATVWRDVAAAKAVPHKRLGVRRKDRRPLERDPLMFSKLFYYVAQVLDVPLPELFLVEDNRGGVMDLVTAIDKRELYPSVVVRPHLLQGKTEREIAFLIASRLVFMRPAYNVKVMLSSDELESVVTQKSIAAVWRDQIARWCDAVDTVSRRTGLVICGDLEAAVRMLTEEKSEGIAQVEARTRELVEFAVSDEYFAVRAQTGLTIAA